ncbi:hypothetical protein E1B28_003670 [Marasmius oreades]|uniref:Uncharacterized protein n=1 Tax=Marasmius oreades TaxID=181124 RepID=A0A9P7UX20_9AGAR|nr:uncharacterized protein E1B28_003670 [Marasmius oreades]KAG7096218.1 hypothetical protein E1B28_003670 [Marasmius oreades]
MDKGVDGLMENVYGRFLAKPRADFKVGYKELMKTGVTEGTQLPGDEYPAKERYPTSVVNWLETMTSVGSFDMLLSKTILHYYCFAEGLPGTKWCCLKHGSERITDKLYEILTTIQPFKKNVRFQFGRRVNHVNYHQCSSNLYRPDQPPHHPDHLKDASFHPCQDPGVMSVTSNGASDINHPMYSQVVLTVSPQCMRYMDLSKRSSLCMLTPGPSIKVGIKFEQNWWADQNITGGQSVTD